MHASLRSQVPKLPMHSAMSADPDWGRGRVTEMVRLTGVVTGFGGLHPMDLVISNLKERPWVQQLDKIMILTIDAVSWYL